MRSVLLALDGSECSFRAVDYCGYQFSGLADLSLVLFHVMSNLPPWFWDPGHLPDDREREGRKEIAEKWIEEQKQAIEPVFQSAVDRLTELGIVPERVRRKTIYDSTDVAGSILEEAKDGRYLTLVLAGAAFPKWAGSSWEAPRPASSIARPDSPSVWSTNPQMLAS